MSNNYTKSSTKLRILSLLLIFNTLNVQAASLLLNEKKEHAARISYVGKITKGDSKKLSNIIYKYKGYITGIELDSLGGDVEEAIRVAGIVEKFQLTTIVPKNKVCGSACFFIFIAGSNRMASSIEQKSLSQDRFGIVGVHRPFLADSTSPKYIAKQQQAMKKVRDYLDNNLIPRRISDAMLSRPSNDVYWLTLNDFDELGTYPPAIEEQLIAKCTYDRNARLNEDRESEQEFTEKQDKIDDCIVNLQFDNYDKMKTMK